MASTITNLINTIDVTFPVAGQDNDSEGFRTNFNIIRQSLLLTENSVEDLQTAVNALGGSVYVTATHIVARQDVTIGGDVITVDEDGNLVVTAEGKSGTIVMRPNTVTAYGAYALTESVTSVTTGTFAVDDIRNIQIGATTTLPLKGSTIYTVAQINTGSNYITVTPEFTTPAFNVGDAIEFVNPFFTGSQQSGDLYVDGDIIATGNITAFAGSPSDSRLKENIVTIDNALDKVNAMRGVYYDWTDDFLQNFAFNVYLPKHDTGVIAQEVQEVIPEVVFVKPNGDFGVRYEKLVGVLIEAVKELSAEVTALKAQVNPTQGQ